MSRTFLGSLLIARTLQYCLAGCNRSSLGSLICDYSSKEREVPRDKVDVMIRKLELLHN